MVNKKDYENNRILKVEVAKTASELERGLMFRKSLDNDAGMLFMFQSPQKLSFWGVNTYIPLDIAFVSADRRIVKISQINALSSKSVSSDKDCVMAIEANLGYFKEHRIIVGDVVDTVDGPFETHCVLFKKFADNEYKQS